MTSLEKFFLYAEGRPFGRGNAWIEIPHGKVYVRLTARPIGKVRLLGTPEWISCLDIASVEIDEEHRSKGIFKNWLKHAEQLADKRNITIYIENVLNDRLKKFFKYNSEYHEFYDYNSRLPGELPCFVRRTRIERYREKK